jgi:hypothetical protein
VVSNHIYAANFADGTLTVINCYGARLRSDGDWSGAVVVAGVPALFSRLGDARTTARPFPEPEQ